MSEPCSRFPLGAFALKDSESDANSSSVATVVATDYSLIYDIKTQLPNMVRPNNDRHNDCRETT